MTENRHDDFTGSGCNSFTGSSKLQIKCLDYLGSCKYNFDILNKSKMIHIKDHIKNQIKNLLEKSLNDLSIYIHVANPSYIIMDIL